MYNYYKILKQNFEVSSSFPGSLISILLDSINDQYCRWKMHSSQILEGVFDVLNLLMADTVSGYLTSFPLCFLLQET